MCNHEAAQLTLRHLVDRTYSPAAEVVDERPQGVERVTWHCSTCDIRGSGTPYDPGLPRWVSERLAGLPAAQ